MAGIFIWRYWWQNKYRQNIKPRNWKVSLKILNSGIILKTFTHVYIHRGDGLLLGVPGVNVLRFLALFLFLFSNKLLVYIRAGISKMLTRPFWQACAISFRKSTVPVLFSCSPPPLPQFSSVLLLEPHYYCF